MLEMRQRGRYRVEVDQLDGRAVGLGELTRHPLPAELQKSAAMAQRFDPVGDAGVLVGDDDADLAVRIRLGLSVVQRGLVIDVVQRDVPHAAQLEAEVGRVSHRQRDDQSLIGPQVEMPDRGVLRRQTARASAAAPPWC